VSHFKTTEGEECEMADGRLIDCEKEVEIWDKSLNHFFPIVPRNIN
jgi:hypothetical protein